MAVDRFPIEAGHVMMFARSIGDANPQFHGAQDPQADTEGAPVPPTFLQSSAQFDPDYFLRPKIGEPWFGSGREATGVDRAGGSGGSGGGGLHAEQHFEFHRPPRVGDVLTATVRQGDTWEKEGRRAGKLVFTETVTEYRDADGELVVTARGIGVRTERPATAG